MERAGNEVTEVKRQSHVAVSRVSHSWCHRTDIHCIAPIPGVYSSYSMHIEYQVSYTSVHSKHLPDFLSPIPVPLKAYINSYM